MRVNIRIDGLEDLQKKLKLTATMDDVKRVVKQNGSELQQKMQDKADFKKGYATGQTKDSIKCEIKDSGLAAEVGPTTEYSGYLEYGTRFMDAQPYIRPAFEEQKRQFVKDLNKLVK